MQIGVLGTGMVGSTIATKLVQLGHTVKMGSRAASNPKAVEWAKGAGALASSGTYAEAGALGEIVFNCTNGSGSLEALRLAGAGNLQGKILIDVSNPLDFTKGAPPSLFVYNTDSLGEQIQRAFPQSKVVKTLNTVTAGIMVNPRQLSGETDVFISGNDRDAKLNVKEILTGWFGWTSVIDLGDISTARGVEMYLPLWLRLWGTLQTGTFNIKIVR